jgi:UrcA family protein
MNTKQKFSKLYRMIAAAAFTGLAVGFAAACPAEGSTDAPEATVKFADLNVSSPQGAASLYSRIRGAANTVCRTLEGRDLTSKTLFDRCVQKAIADAVNQVNQAQLYEVYNAKNKAPKPIMLASGGTR